MCAVILTTIEGVRRDYFVAARTKMSLEQQKQHNHTYQLKNSYAHVVEMLSLTLNTIKNNMPMATVGTKECTGSYNCKLVVTRSQQWMWNTC